MSLLTYTEVRPWAAAIKEEVLNRRMPPWGAVKGFGDFRDDASLSQEEIMRIADWVEGGAPEGDPIYLPARPGATAPATTPRGRRVRHLSGSTLLLGIHPLNSAKTVQVVANLPKGGTVPLLWLRDYNRSWNRTFVYRDPILLPSGTTITANPAYSFEFVVQRPSRATPAR